MNYLKVDWVKKSLMISTWDSSRDYLGNFCSRFVAYPVNRHVPRMNYKITAVKSEFWLTVED